MILIYVLNVSLYITDELSVDKQRLSYCILLYTTSNRMETWLKILLFFAILLKYKILPLQSFSEIFLFVDRRTMMYVVGNFQEKTDFDSSSGHLQALFIK